jgi:hypothetical protein
MAHLEAEKLGGIIAIIVTLVYLRESRAKVNPAKEKQEGTGDEMDVTRWKFQGTGEM